MRHEHIEVPENQRLSCLKFILKKEIFSWNGGAIEEEVEEYDDKNNENIKNMTIRLMESDVQESENIEKLEKKENVISKKKDSKEMKKSPLKRLLNRKEKKIEVTTEIKTKEIVEEEVIAKNVPQDTSENKSPYVSHFSAFPAASSQSPARPFQAVIFADDEQLAVTVCDTVRTLLSQKGE